MHSRDATRAAVQLAMTDSKQGIDTMTTNIQKLNKIPEAYKKAPAYGKMQGVLYGVPVGLAAGGLTYGALSLLPWIRKKKGMKAILSLLAAVGGGMYVGKPLSAKARDIYFENATGVKSPWQTYDVNGKKVQPSSIIDAYAREFEKAKPDPIGYFKEQYSKNINEQQPHRTAIPSNVVDAYSDAWDNAKADPVKYIQDTFDQNMGR